MSEKVHITRQATITLFPFKDYFKGFEDVEAVKGIFGETKTSQILDNVKVEFYSGNRGYMGVHDDDGHIRINATYLREGEDRSLYLDIIHELVHVKQHMDSRALRDPKFKYVDRPTEIEAYKVAVTEARRIGLSEKEIFQYLKMDGMERREHERLAKNVGVNLSSKKSKRKKRQKTDRRVGASRAR